MAIIHNSITINATPEAVWNVLANPEMLDRYDPIVSTSKLISAVRWGMGAERHCDTRSGWFKDRITEWEPYRKLTFTLTGCNQPMESLTHSYELKEVGSETEVSQVMMYTMKYGILGRSIDFIVGKKQSDKQIKMFFEGLKEFVEKEGKESSTVKL